jgi:hypothetical protein
MTRYRALLLMLAIVAAVIPVIPHLGDPVWQDEAYTLMRFASQGWLYPFTDYHLPNNHVLLSSALSGWWSAGESVSQIRAPLLVVYILSVLCLAGTVYWRFGALEAAAVLFVFVAGAIVPIFALQLRAYGPSWLFVVIMLAAMIRLVETGRWTAGIAFSLAGAALLACVPSNALVVAVFAFAGLLHLLSTKATCVQKSKVAAVLALGPLPGLIAYLGIWRHVLAAMRHPFSDWGRPQLLLEFFGTLLADRVVYLPFVALGIVVLWKEARRGDTAARFVQSMMTAVVLVPLLFVMLAPAAPFPRNLVPLMPLLSFVLGLSLAWGLKSMPWIGGSGSRMTLALLVASVAAIVLPRLGIDCTRISELHRVDNLCRPYFQNRYEPEIVVAHLLKNPDLRKRPILANYEAFYALLFLDFNFQLNLNLSFVNDYQQESDRPVPVLVAGGAETVEELQLLAKLDQVPYELALDSGYFRVYAPAVPSN